jgi:hypothetical protein
MHCNLLTIVWTGTQAVKRPRMVWRLHVVHTLKLYGRMNRSAMPSPITRRIHSSKFLGFVFAIWFATLASIRPVRHLICKHDECDIRFYDTRFRAQWHHDSDPHKASSACRGMLQWCTWSSVSRALMLF